IGRTSYLATTIGIGRACTPEAPGPSGGFFDLGPRGHSAVRVLSVHTATLAGAGVGTYDCLDDARSGDRDRRDVQPGWAANEVAVEVDLRRRTRLRAAALPPLRVGCQGMGVGGSDTARFCFHAVFCHRSHLSRWARRFSLESPSA